MNLYVGNLSYEVTEDDVRELFQEYGEVTQVTLVKDRATQQPRGFGFVEMAQKSEALNAIRELNGAEFCERVLKVSEAKPRSNDAPRSNGGGGGGGGQRRQGGYFQNNRNSGNRRNNDW